MSKALDISGLDRSILQDFETREDIRSYIAEKYGHEYAERVTHLIEVCPHCHQNPDTCPCTE